MVRATREFTGIKIVKYFVIGGIVTIGETVLENGRVESGGGGETRRA